MNTNVSEYILEMHDIVKEFPGVRALKGVQLNVRPGTVHTLMGENGAGKSTLMKCLIGIQPCTSGKIIFDGKEVEFKSPLQAMNAGITMIHQELSPVPDRTVCENLWLGRFPMKNKLMCDHKRARKEAKELFEKWNLALNPDDMMRDLTVAQQQMVEIAKAVSYDTKVVVMDEPTSALTETEVEHLFDIIADLKSKNVAIIYISHKMEEIFRISDDISVFRDGEYIGTDRAANLNVDKVVEMMVGRQVGNMFPKVDCEIGDVILEVKDLASGKAFEHVSFQVHRGEIFGFAGLVGAGRTEIVETIFGMRKRTAGQIFLNGKEVNIKSPEDAIANSIGLLTEDRRGNGIFGLLDITENTVMASLKNYGFPQNHKKMETDAIKWNQAMRTKTPSMRQRIMNLSGGNQQKVLLARWLLLNPDILIVDEPTRGIDVGAKSEIHSIITQLAGEGKAIIMISSELPEVSGMADRILVMYEGHMMGIIDRNRDGGDPYDSQELLTYAHGEKNDFATAK